MASREAVRRAVQNVRPILSVDREEARKRVLNLYKAWYRQIPYIGEYLGSEIPPMSSVACYVIASFDLEEERFAWTWPMDLLFFFRYLMKNFVYF